MSLASRAQLSTVVSFLYRWQRIHTGGFVKAARLLSLAKQRVESLKTFSKHHPDSALSVDSVLRRVFSSAQATVDDALKSLKAILVDFEFAIDSLAAAVSGWPVEDPMAQLVCELLESSREELGFRKCLVDEFAKSETGTELQPLLIICSELEDFAAAKAQAFELDSSVSIGLKIAGLDSLRKTLKDRIT